MAQNPARAARNKRLEAQLPDGVVAECYTVNRFKEVYTALVSHDEIASGVKRWHISVSNAHKRERVSEAALIDICHVLRPGVIFCSPLPPRSMWVNVHPGVSHAWQIEDPPLEAQWREDGLAAQRAGFGGPDGVESSVDG